MAKEVFNRFEHKYLLNQKTYEEVLCQMDRHMELDAYNAGHKPYTIANIYYDTADDYLIRTSLSSPTYREKLRLRAYGVPKMDSTVFLEIKRSIMGLSINDVPRFVWRMPIGLSKAENALTAQKESICKCSVSFLIFLRITRFFQSYIWHTTASRILKREILILEFRSTRTFVPDERRFLLKKGIMVRR